MKTITTIFLLFLTVQVMSQTEFMMGDSDNDIGNPIDCSALDVANNFFDNGGQMGNYSSNFNDTLTLCPDAVGGNKLKFSLALAGMINIHPSDTLFVYDGPDATGTPVAAINNMSYVSGYSFTSSFANTSGCLTFVFVSDGANELGGFEALIECVNPDQPFDLNSEVYVNNDYSNNLILDDTTLNIDVCIGDTVEFIIDRNYPNSLESLGTGYSQNNTNVNVVWNSSLGQVTANVDTIQFVIDDYSGFIVEVVATDAMSYSERRNFNIRTGVRPSFHNYTDPDTLCLGGDLQLFGGFKQSDSSAYGVDYAGPGSIQIGGQVAGETYLDDIPGGEFNSIINITGFPAGDTIGPNCGIEKICINMEHSFLGDLEAFLICPGNEDTVIMFNSYTTGGSAVGVLPGGFGGGGVQLGEPASGLPGIGYDYCFLNTGAGGTLAEAMNNGGVVNNVLLAGDYQPETPYNIALEGCQLNGEWRLVVRDNWEGDDGYIFNWSIDFEDCFYDDSLTYVNYVDTAYWNNVSPIVSQTDSTLNTVASIEGDNYYNFIIQDNFGCFHDTVVSAFVWPGIDLNIPDSVCGSDYTATSNIGENGVWSFYNSPGTVTFGSVNLINTSISVDVPGIYNLVYTDLTCGDADTAQVNFLEIPTFNMSGNFFYCPNDTPVITVNDSLNFASINWGVSTEVDDTTFIYSLPNGGFVVSAVGVNTCVVDTTILITTQLPIVLSADTHSCGLSYEMLQNQWGLQTNGGTWEQISGPGNSMFLDVNALNTTVTADQYGVYSYRYIEPVCGNGDTIVITMSDNPEFDLGNVDYFYCPGTTENIAIQDSLNLSSASWGIANPALDTLFSAQLEEGMHTLTIVNMFGCSNDSTFTITTQQAIQLSVQPEICGDSLYMNANIGSEPGFWQSINSQGETGQVTFWSPHTLTTSVSLDQLDTYQLIYTDSVCYDSDTATVKFNPYPSVYGENVVVCSGESGVLVVQPYGEPETIVWENGVTGTTITVTDEGEYEVVATNGCGSFTTSIMLEKRDCEVKMPNVFTPNGKGGNDLFKVIDVNNGIVEFNCEIVNRWGNVVYEYNDINSGWDGNTKNGTPAEDGTYFYKVTAKTVSGVDLSTEGFVQLIR